MQHRAIPLFSITASMLFGCVTRTAEIRPVAPVVEASSAPVTARGSRYLAVPSAPALSGTSSIEQDADPSRLEPSDNQSGVRVEAVIQGASSGRSLLFEKDTLTKPAVHLEH